MQRVSAGSTSIVTIGPFVDDTDFKTLKTIAFTLAVADIRLIKRGSTSSGPKADTTVPVFIENGMYGVTLNGANDLDTTGRMRVHVAKAGALVVWEDIEVVPAAIYTSLVLGTTTLTSDITSNIKKNTALSNYEFLMTLTGTNTPATGKTITSQRSGGGTAFAPTTNTAVEVANGIYKIDLSSADLNYNVVTLRFTEASCNDRLITVITQP